MRCNEALQVPELGELEASAHPARGSNCASDLRGLKTIQADVSLCDKAKTRAVHI